MSEPRPESCATPLWLLDIDGVVNAVAREGALDAWPRSAWVRRMITTWVPDRGMMTLPILAARPVLDFITQVHESGSAEIRWHSTWRTAAVTAFAPMLGLPAIPISIAPEWTERPVGLWWKLPAAQRAVATGRRLIWTDDDLRFYAHEIGDLAQRDDALVIGPPSDTGLTPTHLAAIAEFIGR
jgi:hypothetical protein